jgi:hypothetical protein
MDGGSGSQAALGAAECCRGLTAVSGVACPQGEQPTTIFYLFGNFTPYTYARNFLAKVTILCNRGAFQGPGGSVR